MIKQILLIFAVVGVQGASLHGGSSSSSRHEDGHGNYEFRYDVVDHLGATNGRHEVGDAYGNKKGSYSLTDIDGRSRRVDYVADSYGFRAVVHSNEPGVANSKPADAVISSSYDGAIPEKRVHAEPVHHDYIEEPHAYAARPPPSAYGNVYDAPRHVDSPVSAAISSHHDVPHPPAPAPLSHGTVLLPQPAAAVSSPGAPSHAASAPIAPHGHSTLLEPGSPSLVHRNEPALASQLLDEPVIPPSHGILLVPGSLPKEPSLAVEPAVPSSHSITLNPVAPVVSSVPVAQPLAVEEVSLVSNPVVSHSARIIPSALLGSPLSPNVQYLESSADVATSDVVVPIQPLSHSTLLLGSPSLRHDSLPEVDDVAADVGIHANPLSLAFRIPAASSPISPPLDDPVPSLQHDSLPEVDDVAADVGFHANPLSLAFRIPAASSPISSPLDPVPHPVARVSLARTLSHAESI